MRENFRAEVRHIASGVASDAIIRYADALARSPYAQQTMDETARRVATEVAAEVAGGRVAHAEEIVRTAASRAEETATRTALQVAEKTASNLGAKAAADVLGEARASIKKTLEKDRRELGATLDKDRRERDETFASARQELGETLEKDRREREETFARARQEIDDTLDRERSKLSRTVSTTRAELKDARAELTRSVAEFAREVAVRAVAETVAETVPPVIDVRVGSAADPGRIVGHTHSVLPDVLLTLGAGCHVLLVGPAGTGKSMMAQQAAAGFGQEFHALSLGPTTPMSKIFGYYDAHGNYHGTPFRRAFEHGGLMLLDELDSGHPGLLAELNQALSIRTCAFADGMVAAHPDFRLMATANTYGTGGDRQYVGRQALDAATLDRFVIMDVPVDESLEERLALAHAPERLADARRVIEEVRRLRATAAEKRLPVMFSPRASIDAAKLLQAGASVEQAVKWRVVRGMSEAHQSALGLAGHGGEGKK